MADVFISYSFHDREFVEELCEQLRSNGFTPWAYAEKIKIGDVILVEMAKNIAKSRFLIPVFSKNSVLSPYVEYEWSLKYWEELGRRKTMVIPVKIDDCVIPTGLQLKAWADFSGTANFNDVFQKVLFSLSSGVQEKTDKSTSKVCNSENSESEKGAKEKNIEENTTINEKENQARPQLSKKQKRWVYASVTAALLVVGTVVYFLTSSSSDPDDVTDPITVTDSTAPFLKDITNNNSVNNVESDEKMRSNDSVITLKQVVFSAPKDSALSLARKIETKKNEMMDRAIEN